MSQFSQGKWAQATCDRCGDKVLYKTLKEEWTGFMVCKDCLDPKTKLEFPTYFPTDAESLRNPRPDNDMEASDGTVYIGDDDLGQSFRTSATVVALGTVTTSII